MNAVLIANIPNSKQVRRGRLLAYLTIGWNSLEAIIAVGAGIVAGSIALIGFGFDSVIEVSSGAIILWRLASGEKSCPNAINRILPVIFANLPSD